MIPRVRLIWQSPRMFARAGLFLDVRAFGYRGRLRLLPAVLR